MCFSLLVSWLGCLVLLFQSLFCEWSKSQNILAAVKREHRDFFPTTKVGGGSEQVAKCITTFYFYIYFHGLDGLSLCFFSHLQNATCCRVQCKRWHAGQSIKIFVLRSYMTMLDPSSPHTHTLFFFNNKMILWKIILRAVVAFFSLVRSLENV